MALWHEICKRSQENPTEILQHQLLKVKKSPKIHVEEDYGVPTSKIDTEFLQEPIEEGGISHVEQDLGVPFSKIDPIFNDFVFKNSKNVEEDFGVPVSKSEKVLERGERLNDGVFVRLQNIFDSVGNTIKLKFN